MNTFSNTRMPVLYLPHGGGPLPLMGDSQHKSLIGFLTSIAAHLGEPRRILLISAHWEAVIPTIIGSARPPLIYDYYNFPPETYKIEYPAAGDPELADRVHELLNSSGIESKIDSKRGFDHGMFVPLKLMYPKADIPCVQLSLQSSLDPSDHIDLGRALADLRNEGVLIVGSGLSFHNMQALMSLDEGKEEAVEFDRWLVDTCTNSNLSKSQISERLSHWTQAPHARFCHPREEHLLPLHVCYGAAEQESSVARMVFNDELMGSKTSGFLWE